MTDLPGVGPSPPKSILWLNQLDPLHPWAGGAERPIAEVGRRLVRGGNQLTVVAEQFGPLRAAETWEGIEIVRPVRRGLLHAWVLANARRLVERLRADVVVGDLSKIIPWGRRGLGGKPLVSIVRHFNGRTVFGEAAFPAPPLLWTIERGTPWLLRRSRIITEARATADVLTNLGGPRTAVTLVPPGVDTVQYRPDPTRRSRTPLVVYVGRLKRYKRVDLALEAFRLVLRHRPDARMEIAGGGTDHDRLVEHAHDLGVAGSVRFHGPGTLDDITALYQRGWVHVQPSAAEGWGLTALESMACGTPVAAFDAAALRESVGPLCADLLAPDGNVEELSQSILRGFERTERATAESTTRLVEYASSFSWESTAAGYARVLGQADLGLGSALPTRWESQFGRGRGYAETVERTPDARDLA
jgi:glycosyltransferase involved in cell wall biosynthesis